MVQFDKSEHIVPSFKEDTMETCVLIPEDFALKVESDKSPSSTPHYASLLGNLIPSIMALADQERKAHSENPVKVCAAKSLSANTRYLPFSGTVRIDKLPVMPSLTALDVSTIDDLMFSMT